MSLERQYALEVRALSHRGRIRGIVWYLDGFMVFWARVSERWVPEPPDHDVGPSIYLVDPSSSYL